MNCNFYTKMDKLEKLLNNWSYRYLTPFGKATVIKSLGLSKLSHIAIVLPNPTREMITRIEKMIFKFIWGGGSEKVRREDTKLPTNYGGLALPDISKFWNAFKFSWFRRLLVSDSFWPQLVSNSVSTFMDKNLTVTDILQLGGSKLAEISKKLYNPFWKQVFYTAIPMTEGILFAYPEKILSSPLFYNPFVVRQRIVKPADFPELVMPGITLSYFFYQGTNIFMDWEYFKTHYGIEITYEKFIDIRYTIRAAIAKLRLPYSKLNLVNFPEIPLLIEIALSTVKGCSQYYKILNKKSNFNNKIFQRETKWHLELDQTLSLQFWATARKFYASIDFDNSLKWLQFQIVRNSSETNYIVHRFKPHVPPTCSYCMDLESSEKISHLFWDCFRVMEFLEETFTFISSTGLILNFNPTKLQFLFGITNEPFYSPKNYIMMVLKKYIWQNKFKSNNLSMVGFKNLLKVCITDLKVLCVIKSKPELVVEWDTLATLL